MFPRGTFGDMAKKRKKNKMPYIIAASMSVLAAAAVGLFFYSGGFNPERPTAEPETTRMEMVTKPASADGLITRRVAAEYPLMPTEIEGVFVSANPLGQFEFYDYADGAFTACTDAKELDVTVTCSHQQLPAKLYYLQRGDTLAGYGLFRNSQYPDVRLYDYAFLHAVNMPAGYGSGDAMLLADFDKADFAKADKIYSEVFSLNLSNGKTNRLTSDNGRTVDIDARLRTDWAQMNGALLGLGAEKWYLSGRNYQLDSTKADIIYNADTSNTKPKWIASGLYENALFNEDGTLFYVKQTDAGVDAYSLAKDGTETKLGSYAGSVDDYLFADGYMLEKNTLTLTRLATGESKSIGTVVDAAVGSPAYFGVSPDGAKFVLLFDGEEQGAALLDLTTNACKYTYDKSLFANSCSQITWLSAGSFATVAESESGYETLLWAF